MRASLLLLPQVSLHVAWHRAGVRGVAANSLRLAAAHRCDGELVASLRGGEGCSAAERQEEEKRADEGAVRNGQQTERKAALAYNCAARSEEAHL